MAKPTTNRSFDSLRQILLDANKSVLGEDDARLRLRKRNPKIAQLEAEALMTAGRGDAFLEMSQKEADRAIGAVAAEETELQQGLKTLLTQKTLPGLQPAYEYYTQKLQNIYWSSSQEPPTLSDKEDRITTDYLPQLDDIVKAINEDKVFNVRNGEFRKPLLKFAKKIKSELTARNTLQSRLKTTASKLFTSDIGQGFLTALATRNPLLGLGVTLLKSSQQKKNTYAIRQKRAQQELSNERNVTRRNVELEGRIAKAKEEQAKKNLPEISPEPSTAATAFPEPPAEPTAPPTALGATATPTGTFAGLYGAGGELAVVPDIGGAASSGTASPANATLTKILGVLIQHAKLLQEILGVNKASAEFQRKLQEQQQLAAEETEEETGSAAPLSSPRDTATLDKDEDKGEDEGEGFGMDRLMRLLMRRRGGLGRLGRLMRGGSALLRGGAARLATTGAAAAATGAAATAGTAIAATATKEIAGEVLESGAKKALGKGGAKAAIKAAVKNLVPTQIAKVAGKSIPFLGAAIAGGFALAKMFRGDFTGAGLEMASAIPGAGILASILGMARDIYHSVYGVQPEDDPESGARFAEIKQEVQTAADEKLQELGLKGKKENDQKDAAAQQKDQENIDAAIEEDRARTSGGAPPAVSTEQSGGGQAPAPPSAPTPSGGGAAPAQTPAPTPSGGGAAPAPTPTATPAGGGGPTEKPQLATIKTKSGKTAQVGAAYKNNFQGFINDLEATGYVIRSIGGYVDRPNRNNPRVKSYHALGASIDINPDTNPNRSTKTDMPPETGALAKKWGLGWGMNWKSVKDPMHFSIAKGEGGSVDIARSAGPGAPPAAPGPDTSPAATGGGGVGGGVSATPDMIGGSGGIGMTTGSGALSPTPAPTAGGGAPSATSIPTDVTATGRAALMSGISAPSGAVGGGGGDVNVMQGGTTVIGGGGNTGGGAQQPILAPIDREPTIRRILDGPLT